MAKIRLKCATCGLTPELYIERYKGDLFLASRCECGNYVCIDTSDDFSSLLTFWNESNKQEENASECERLHDFCTELFDKLMSIFFAETLEEEAYMLELYERARQFGIIREP